MATLSKFDILERLRLRVSNPKGLTITPLLDREACLDEDSIDLRLGTRFLLPQVPPQPFYDPNRPQSARESYLELHVPIGGYFVLPAHQTVLGATLEFIKMPFDVSGEILTKSSIARSFMVIETAPWIHPSYRGCLTLEIANVSNTAILLYPGIPIGQLILMTTTIKGSQRPKQLSGSYMGPVFPEAPRFPTIEDQFAKIGVDSFRRPEHGWVNAGQMQTQVKQAMEKLSPIELANIRNLVVILRENGGIPLDSPILKLLEG